MWKFKMILWTIQNNFSEWEYMSKDRRKFQVYKELAVINIISYNNWLKYYTYD